MLGVPVSTQLHVIERFTRVSDDVINWQVLIADPETYTEPWALELPLTRNTAYTLYEHACHEGNRAVSAILGVARHLEQRPVAK